MEQQINRIIEFLSRLLGYKAPMNAKVLSGTINPGIPFRVIIGTSGTLTSVIDANGNVLGTITVPAGDLSIQFTSITVGTAVGIAVW